MDDQPLAGFRIGVTAARKVEEQVVLLERRGARVERAPALSLDPNHVDGEGLRAATADVVSRPGTPRATPMLTVRVSISPSIETRSRSVSCSRLARASASVADIGTSGTTTNSSPPRRAIRLGLSAPSSSRLAKTRMNQSPAVCPR